MMRLSRWTYAAVNAAHILGIALLVGAILPLDLRLLGLWRSQPLAPLARVLVPTAAAGLVLAAAAGALLFLARPADYASRPVFLAKLLLIALGATSALALHLGPGLEGAGVARRRLAGLLSVACWIPALVLGRLIAFTGPD
jgi:hypothetical protein